MKSLVSKVKMDIFQMVNYCNNPITKEKYMKMENSLRFMLLLQFVLCLVGQIAVFATGTTGGTGTATGSQASTLVTNLLNIMVSVFRYVGFALIVWGITQFLLAVKKSDAESKSEAVTTAIVGIALVSLSVIVNSMGIGVTVSDSGVF